MRRGSAGLIAAVFALAGCKSTGDPKPGDRDARGNVAARTRDPQGPTWFDPAARLPGAGTSVPKAGTSGGDPKSPDFDARAEAKDGISGRVVDAYNHPAKEVFIRVEAVSDAPGDGSKEIGIYTDGSGYFFTRGLKVGAAYNLTAEAKQDGRELSGTVQTRVPSSALTIVLREGFGLPPEVPESPRKATGGFPPPPVPTGSDHIPPAGLGPVGGAPPRVPSDGAYRPGGGATHPVPPAIGGAPPGSPLPAAPTGGLPEPDDLTPTDRPLRPENVADGPRTPFTPPAANIPGPVPTPRLPVPPPAPPGGQSRGTGNFRLLDSLERNWDFATDKTGSVVLVEFVTTSCPHCKPVIPVLKDLQSRYAADGLQVVAVLCDDAPQKQRAAAAGKYARDNNTNYPVFSEVGADPGAVRDALGVKAYPGAVLLASDGTVLWSGHPGEKAKLEAAVRRSLGK
jgi:thiol-disulfide isomerase/thioredoxin